MLTAEPVERSLLGGVIQEPRKLAELSPLVSAADFANPRHGNLWRLLLARQAAGQPIDLVQIPEAVAATGKHEDYGGVAYVAMLPDHVPSTTNLDYYARQVADLARKRRAVDAAQRFAARIQAADDLDEAVAGLTRELHDERAGEATSAHVGEILEQVSEDIRAEEHGEAPGPMSTPWPELDQLCGGGLLPGELVVLAGRPGMAKTATAVELAVGMAGEGRRVGVFSLEMTQKQLGRRILAGLSGVSLGRMKNARRTRLSTTEWERIYAAVERRNELAMWVDDRGGLTVDQIAAQATLWSQTHGLDLVVVDYLTLVRTGERYRGNRVAEVSEVITTLRDLGKRLGCVMVVLSQLNRAVEGRNDKRPLMSDLRETGKIEEDANHVWMLYRENYYSPDSDSCLFDGRHADVLELLVRKQRDGSCGTVRLAFDGPRMRVGSPDVAEHGGAA